MSLPTLTSTTGTVDFFVAPEDGSRAYQMRNAKLDTGVRDRNFGLEAREIKIANLRGNESTASLDKTGFQLVKQPAKHTSFTNEADIKKGYYGESAELLKKVTGASRVVIYDHTVRRRRPGEIDSSASKRQPLSQAHVDQTPKSATAAVHRILPAEEVPELLKHRFQLINLWRPINNPASDWPLALCDFRSVDPVADVAPVALVYDDREGETYQVKYNEKHKWKYFSNVTPEEGILIKCYDSVQDGSVALYTPHTAFSDPLTPTDAPLRESIEVRALVFYD
ncbi:hypothetical protein R3P38DRAFT_3386819 [Favolaschia claudopus]|uniref:Methyltransferase n=1 Tax=Favolaschia claudopus TaxID=2862362 RepID=A0AAW0DL92_9AGAR